jgi:hypothetical protein
MQRHVSELAMQDLGEAGMEIIGTPCLDRSLQKWQAGMRTTKRASTVWPIIFQGRPLEGEFLLSGYIGGTYAVITTATDQWLVLTTELGQGDAVQAEISSKATPFAHVGQPDVKDGQHRTGM